MPSREKPAIVTNKRTVRLITVMPMVNIAEPLIPHAITMAETTQGTTARKLQVVPAISQAFNQ